MAGREVRSQDPPPPIAVVIVGTYYENTPARIASDHGLYLDLARVGGADSLWERTCSPHGTSAMCESGDGIRLLFGAGHLGILRELVRSAPGLQLIDPRLHL